MITYIQVFPDGSLYFHSISLQHIGNYTCLDTSSQEEEITSRTHTIMVNSTYNLQNISHPLGGFRLVSIYIR